MNQIFTYVQNETRKRSYERQCPFFEFKGGAEIILPAIPLKRFYVPENPNNVKIATNHEIGQISVTVNPVELPQGVQPQAIPEIPESLRRTQAEIAGIEQAVEQLKAGTRSTLKSTQNTLSNAKSQSSDDVEYAFRWCPAGEFTMGSGSDAHQVKLTQGFWMLETQVTQKMWQSVMGGNPSYFTGDKLPVECVSWNDCQEFCKKLRAKGLNVQLPTEAQWEYACRAGTTGDYAGNLDEMAWYVENSSSKTQDVGLKKPNEWGLYDMYGNVWEWCYDWYGSYPNGTVTDPTGPTSGSYRVNRGGGWIFVAEGCRSASRGNDSPDFRDFSLGFRLVWVPGPE